MKTKKKFTSSFVYLLNQGLLHCRYFSLKSIPFKNSLTCYMPMVYGHCQLSSHFSYASINGTDEFLIRSCCVSSFISGTPSKLVYTVYFVGKNSFDLHLY